MNKILNEALSLSDKMIEDYESHNFRELPILLDQAHQRISELQSHINLVQQQNQALRTEITYLRKTQEERQKIANESILFFKRNEENLLTDQKEQYEESLRRQLKMIETLVEDKRQLADEVCTLHEELKQLCIRLEKEKRSQDDRLKVMRDQLLSQENVKRAKWEKRKTAEIKEMTIKSIEPELQRLIDKHEIEIRTLKHFYEQKIAEITNA